MSTQRLVGDATWQVWVVTFGVAAAVAIGAASLVRDIGDRGPRATGVLLALATVNVFGAAYQVAVGLSLGSSEELVVGSIAALGVALLARRWQPGLVTQGVLLASIATLAATGGSLMKARLLGPSMPVSNVGELAMDLALWLVVALAFGWLGLRESSVGTVEAGRRAALSRFAAGATAVVATAAILTRSGPVGMDRWDRLVEPVVADVAIAVLSIGLLWLALRRGTAAYLYPAALGIIIALTDLNASYVADQVGTGVALLLEGSLIIAAGFMADRIRRRLRVA